MLMADTLAIALVILGALLSLNGSWLLCRALWPDRVAKSAARCERNRWLSLIVGTLVTVAVIAVATVVAQAGQPGQFAWFVIMSVFFVYALTGVAGLATHIGQRLESPVDDLRPWRSTLRGGIALSLAYLIPLPGWLLLPASFFVGAGAMTLSFFGRNRPDPDARPLPPLEATPGGRFAPPPPMPGGFRHEPAQHEVMR